MSINAESIAHELRDDLAALRQDVARLSATLGGVLQAQANGAAHQVSDAVDQARTAFAGTAAEVGARVQAASGDIEAGIERNPLRAVLVTFAVGVALGMLSRSRH